MKAALFFVGPSLDEQPFDVTRVLPLIIDRHHNGGFLGVKSLMCLANGLRVPKKMPRCDKGCAAGYERAVDMGVGEVGVLAEEDAKVRVGVGYRVVGFDCSVELFCDCVDGYWADVGP